MANVNTKIFKSLNESEYKELYTPKRTLTEATTDVNEVAEEYKEAYHIDLDLKRVPCVIARDKFLSGWGGADGKTHYQVVLCGDSTEAANIESSMRSCAAEEGLSNIRRDFGVKLSSRVSASYVVGRYASAWNTLSDNWYENRFGSSNTEDEQQVNESEKLDESKVYRDTENPSDYIVLSDSGELEKTSAGDIINFGKVCGFNKVNNTTYLVVKDDDNKIYLYSIDTGFPFTFDLASESTELGESELKEWKDGGSINQYATTFVLNSNLSEEELEPKIQEALSELEKDEAIERPIKDITIRHTSTIHKNLPESNNLKEEYSEKLGGEPEDFIKDVECIKIGLMSIHRSEMVTHLAQEMIDQFIDTCDSQISMAKSRFLGESEKKKLKENLIEVNNEEELDKTVILLKDIKTSNGLNIVFYKNVYFVVTDEELEELRKNNISILGKKARARSIEELLKDMENCIVESEDIEEFKKKYSKSFNSWKKENPQASDKEIVDILKAKQYNGELNEDENTVHKMKDCTDDVEVIMALEGDTLELDDMEDWNRLKELAKSLSRSQGFYGRLLANMEEVEEEDLEFPIYL